MLSRLRGVFVVIAVALALSAAPLSAQDATPAASDLLLPPDAEVAGAGLGEWSARQWQWMLSFPEETSPLFDDTGARCGYGQSGPVFFLAGSGTGESFERSCTVPAGVTIFVPLGAGECSTVEPAPYFGRDEDELRACITALIDADRAYFETVTLTVDGMSVGSIQPYRASTPMGTWVLPDDNIYGAPAGVANFVADGYQAFLTPLSPGEHEVVISDPDISVTYHLTITEPEIVEPEASPTAWRSADHHARRGSGDCTGAPTSISDEERDQHGSGQAAGGGRGEEQQPGARQRSRSPDRLGRGDAPQHR